MNAEIFIELLHLHIESQNLEIASLRALLGEAGRALAPFVEFTPKALAFVEARARASNDVPASMPTKHFTLAHFETAVVVGQEIKEKLAAAAGLEPATLPLTAEDSTD